MSKSRKLGISTLAAVLIAVIITALVVGSAVYFLTPRGSTEEYPFTCPYCGGKFPNEDALNQHIWNDHPILISGGLPLTGSLAKNAEKIKMAYEDWAEYVNEHGGILGRRVVLKILDTEGDITLGTEIAEKAITVDHCDFLLPWYEGHVGRAVMGVAESHHMLYTGMGGHNASFHQGYWYVASAPPLMGEWWAAGLSDLILSLPEEKRPTKAFIMSARLTIFEACGKSLYEELDKAGIPYTEEWYDLPLTNADPLILSAMDYGADFLILNGLLPDGTLAVQAADRLGYKPRWLWQSVGSPDPEWVAILGDLAEGTITGSAWVPGREEELLPYYRNDLIWEIWTEKHADEYGEEVLLYYGLGWCWMTTLELGIKGAGNFSQEAVRNWLHTNIITNPAGNITLNEFGYPTKPINYILQWQKIDGEWKLKTVWPPEVANAEVKVGD